MSELPHHVALKFATALALLLLAAAALSSLQGFNSRFEHHQSPVLPYDTFDQRPGEGWRKLADDGDFLEAAQLIDRFERETGDLKDWQRVNLRFHSGQCYAFANRKDEALARFKTALNASEPPDSTIKWNAYVRATIAFLEGDRAKLTELRREIADGPKFEGEETPNLDVVNHLLEFFDEPYAVAYRGKPKE